VYAFNVHTLHVGLGMCSSSRAAGTRAR